MSRIPLLSPRAFMDYTAETYHLYIKSLYVAPPVKAAPAEFSVTLNKKGSPVLRISRKPKWLSSAEVTQGASEIGWELQKFWMHVSKKKIEIRVPRRGTK